MLIARQSTARTVTIGPILGSGEWLASSGKRFGGEGVGHRVACTYTTSNSVFLDVKPSSPVANTKRHALMGEKHSRPAVLSLLRRGRPNTVGWFVGSRTVNAFNGVQGRRLQPHVVQESLKGTSPRLADRDSSRAVVSVAFDVGIVASVSDAAPDRELRRSTHTVSSVGAAGSLLVKAPATGRKSSRKVAPDYVLEPATVTEAVPVMKASATGVARHYYSAETSARQVYETRIGWERLIVSHVSFSLGDSR